MSILLDRPVWRNWRLNGATLRSGLAVFWPYFSGWLPLPNETYVFLHMQNPVACPSSFLCLPCVVSMLVLCLSICFAFVLSLSVLCPFLVFHASFLCPAFAFLAVFRLMSAVCVRSSPGDPKHASRRKATVCASDCALQLACRFGKRMVVFSCSTGRLSLCLQQFDACLAFLRKGYGTHTKQNITWLKGRQPNDCPMTDDGRTPSRGVGRG